MTPDTVLGYDEQQNTVYKSMWFLINEFRSNIMCNKNYLHTYTDESQHKKTKQNEQK